MPVKSLLVRTGALQIIDFDFKARNHRDIRCEIGQRQLLNGVHPSPVVAGVHFAGMTRLQNQRQSAGKLLPSANALRSRRETSLALAVRVKQPTG